MLLYLKVSANTVCTKNVVLGCMRMNQLLEEKSQKPFLLTSLRMCN